MNIKVEFQIADDVKQLAHLLTALGSSMNPQTKEVVLAENFIVANDGHTYFLPEIMTLSEKEVTASPVSFKTKDGKTVTLLEVWQTQGLEIQFIYNTPLVNALLTVDLAAEMPLNPTFPICAISSDSNLADPIITPSQQNYDFHGIVPWVTKHKTDPLTREPLEKQDILRNHALKQFIDVYINELIAERTRLLAIEQTEQLTAVQAKLKDYKSVLKEQYNYWKGKLTKSEKKWSDWELLRNAHTSLFRFDINQIDSYRKNLEKHRNYYTKKLNSSIEDSIEKKRRLAIIAPAILQIVGLVTLGVGLLMSGPIGWGIAAISTFVIIGGYILHNVVIPRTIANEESKRAHYESAQEKVSTYQRILKPNSKYLRNQHDPAAMNPKTKCQAIEEQINRVRPAKEAIPLSGARDNMWSNGQAIPENGEQNERQPLLSRVSPQ